MKLRTPLLALLLIASGCASANRATTSATTRPAPTTLVVWISVDGLRPDYLDRAKAPFLKRLAAEGAYSRAMTPPYPSLTFAVHSSQVTGASPSMHGIPGNSFYDRSRSQEYNFPGDPSLLKVEPLWTTAARQGLRVAVFDWPFSQAQTGNFATAYFNDRFDAKQTDDDRMSKLAAVLRYDEGPRGAGAAPRQLSLVMGYIESVDKAGHAMGPDSAAVIEQVERVDRLLAEIHAAATAALARKYPPGSKLYFLVTTDHGMSTVHRAVNLKLLLGDTLPANATVITGGGTGHIFLPESPDKPTQLLALRQKLRDLPAARVFTPDTLPKHWSIRDADRIGDLYIDLPQGYTFNSRSKVALQDLPPLAPPTTSPSSPTTQLLTDATTQPTTTPSTNPYDRPPRGMHSYDPATTPDMLGFIAVSRYPNNFGGRNLGPIDARQFAPTVAEWLNITPPPATEVAPLPIK